MTNIKLVEQVKLFFTDEVEKTRANLSAIIFSHPNCLWCGTDEYTKIERLTRSQEDQHIFTEHQVYQLKDLMTGFDQSEGELDIEGIDYQDGYLWFIGSHSTKRKKAKRDIINKKQLKQVIQEPNRYFLAKIPINQDSDLVSIDGTRQIAWLPRYLLIEILSNDPYLGSIISSKLPGKDNGFDIEGLGVHGNRIFIGLRGPVLRGIAVIVEIEIAQQSGHELQLKVIGEKDRFYRLHFLDLRGSGIRELCFHGEDLFILAGPTMELDGEITLYKLKGILELPENSLCSVDNQKLKLLGEIPHVPGCDRAEGLSIYPSEDNTLSLLTVYDRPKPERLIEDTGVIADIFQVDAG